MDFLKSLGHVYFSPTRSPTAPAHDTAGLPSAWGADCQRTVLARSTGADSTRDRIGCSCVVSRAAGRSEVEIECPNASKYALDMHRPLRWLVGAVASLLGLSLLLVRAGFWATGRTVAEDAQGMRAVLIAIQTEPAVMVYGAIVFFLLIGFALLIPTSKWKKWVTGH